MSTREQLPSAREQLPKRPLCSRRKACRGRGRGGTGCLAVDLAVTSLPLELLFAFQELLFHLELLFHDYPLSITGPSVWVLSIKVRFFTEILFNHRELGALSYQGFYTSLQDFCWQLFLYYTTFIPLKIK